MKNVVINIDRLIDSIHYELTDVDVQNQEVEAQIHGFLSRALETVSKSVTDCFYNLPVSDVTAKSCPAVTVNIQCLVGTLKVTKPSEDAAILKKESDRLFLEKLTDSLQAVLDSSKAVASDDSGSHDISPVVPCQEFAQEP